MGEPARRGRVGNYHRGGGSDRPRGFFDTDEYRGAGEGERLSRWGDRAPMRHAFTQASPKREPRDDETQRERKGRQTPGLSAPPEEISLKTTHRKTKGDKPARDGGRGDYTPLSKYRPIFYLTSRPAAKEAGGDAKPKRLYKEERRKRKATAHKSHPDPLGRAGRVHRGHPPPGGVMWRGMFQASPPKTPPPERR